MHARSAVRILLGAISVAVAACGSDPEPTEPPLSDAELREFANQLGADSYAMMELAEKQPEETIERLLRAAAQEPDEPLWYAAYLMCVAPGVYEARQLDGEARRDRFARVRNRLERMVTVLEGASIESPATNTMVQSLRMETASAAVEAGAIERAAELATQALEEVTRVEAWNRDNLVHEGHTVLGRVAVRRGDLPEAEEHLLASGRVGATAQLSSFGPSFLLARELLDEGGSEAVLAYLDLVRAFWGTPAGTDENERRVVREHAERLADWRAEVAAGRIPEDRRWR